MMADNSSVCPIHGELYAYCDCESIVHVAGGVLPNQRSATKYLLDNEVEEVGKVYRLRKGVYSGYYAIKIGEKLYLISELGLGVKRKKKESE